MTAETTTPATLRTRAVHELRQLAVLAAYLYVALGAMIVYKTAVLHTAGITVTPWGVAAVKALVLAKFMLLGDAMKLAQDRGTKPLIWPTLHKALAFLVLLVVMTMIEEAIVGLLHHRSIADSFAEVMGPRLWETLSHLLIMWLVLVPYCAFEVLDKATGGGWLHRMFFVARGPMPPA